MRSFPLPKRGKKLSIEDKKLKNLKSMGLPWITIQTTSFRSSPQTPEKGNERFDIREHNDKKLRRQSNSAPVTPQAMFRPFSSSTVTFDSEEMQIIENRDDYRKHSALRKSPSKLQQLQLQIIEKEKEKERLRQENQQKEEQPQIPEVDSFISIKFDQEESYLKDVPQEYDDQKKQNEPVYQSDDNTIKDLRISVLKYCNSLKSTIDDKNVQEIKGTINQTRYGTEIRINPSRGRKRVQQAIVDHSIQDDSLDIFSHERILSSEQLEEEKEIRKNIVCTTCGSNLKTFIQQNDIIPPSFLDDVDIKITQPQFNTIQRNPLKIPFPQKNYSYNL
ncbi:hypothetical protein TVAG_459610 [Trichomonas vaginalis G3]|uniref:Uncharacterized protein n=1 Tax=Trichomonas vaginalis (strain ATCC PRA-98 / G3) TaxID=412133 RepID=A2FHM1_TRIV3|nr:hypothetical protein TVAGG3_0741880 [Trichomonas vaginalis G3]EAX95612.1 hypothetical protein TVAG_459610 [Trichomonas vaginalis G3]KAI5511940.1 hypothetical protein TVAGG3_0741880 [Trichomonas vaginalis G3]|eukprot:XP_001308542.1 hypothetical protein [Trichomonas vaginalis G3]